MTISQTAGRSAVTVTSGAAVAMLSVDSADYTAAAGVSIPRAFSGTIILTTTQDVTVKVYVSAGANCGLQLVSGWSATATSTAPYALSWSAQPYQRIYVTAQASGTTATVNCDMIAQSSAVN
jgi:hypothetical protein